MKTKKNQEKRRLYHCLIVISFILGSKIGVGQGIYNEIKESKLDYVGEWINTDEFTNNLTRLIISEEDAQVTAYGKCDPEDCLLGTTNFIVIANKTEIDNYNPFDYGLAIWDNNFSKTIMKFSLDENKIPTLKVQSIRLMRNPSGDGYLDGYQVDATMRRRE